MRIMLQNFRWMFPFLGHMGICTSTGVIRDFAGPYFVSEDLMAFGNPTKYWQLTPQRANNGQAGWDAAVAEASEIYKKRMVTCLSFFDITNVKGLSKKIDIFRGK